PPRPPTTVTPTTCTTWGDACWVTTCPGPPPCSPTTPAPRTRPWWGNAGGRCGTSGWSTAVCGSTRGCATNTATSTGSTVPSPRTWVLYRYRSWPSVGGPTAIPTPCSV